VSPEESLVGSECGSCEVRKPHSRNTELGRAALAPASTSLALVIRV
jgi:hypothetical protein